jgi:hypothetical protein
VLSFIVIVILPAYDTRRRRTIMAATEAKVKASTSAAAVSGMALWLLGRYVFKGTVPDVLASWIYVLVPGVLAWAAGYWAPHTHRPDLPPPP